ncbi:hypothetical protein IT6_00920 [Methylacidiphilum caldifontis]|uniref:hypothetical protein n=1 Tax=Methylacidiphilum caldifontis TaxID=2795386 RepID=UPI001A8D5B6E|nr:hypothetical protein [Methylacidiphilum caldifontis]QSR88902.1 hypothetical protein IT6_00920 [Methylacidiphilum caldifontis]
MNEQKRIELMAHRGNEEKPTAQVQSLQHVPITLSPSGDMTSSNNKNAHGIHLDEKEKLSSTQSPESVEPLNALGMSDLKAIGETKTIARERLNEAMSSTPEQQKEIRENLKFFLERNQQRLMTRDFKSLGEKAEKLSEERCSFCYSNSNLTPNKNTEISIEQQKKETLPSYWNSPEIGKGPLIQGEFWQKAYESRERLKEIEREHKEAPLFKAEGLSPNYNYNSLIPELDQQKTHQKVR